MAISDKLQELLDIKQDIKVAIENKGVDLTGVNFGGYAGKIDEITGGTTGVVKLTQAEYDALSVYDDNTYYLISDINKIYKGTTLLYEEVLPSSIALFYGGMTTQTVINADLDDLSTLNTSDNYGDTIWSIAADDTYIYVGGSTTQTVRKYIKSDLSYVGESPSYGSIIRTIAIDDTYIYAGGQATFPKVKKYLKSDLSYVGESPSHGGIIRTIAIDDTYIYVGGQTVPKVRKYLKSDLSYIGESANYGGSIYSIAIG